MALVTLVEAQPWDPATGVVVPVRLAGGGRRHYRHKGFADWRAGVVNQPRLTELLEFDGSFTGGAIPTANAIGVMPARATTRAEIARLMWVGAPITVSIGDDEAAVPAWTVELAGAVAGYTVQGGMFTFTVANLAGRLDKPLVTATFAATGGIEGVGAAAGRLKRRSWGRCWNVEGRLLDPASNIYEFGDPAQPIAGFDQVKDKGRFGPLAVIGWAGSIDATLAALKAAAAPAGGAAVAPSIACAKWYTQPVAITADLRGEAAGGYVETVAGIAAAISAAAGGPPVVDLAAAIAARPDPAGLHVDDAGERGVAALDRLLLRASMGWTIVASGGLSIASLAFADPVATIVGGAVEREAAFAPVTAVTIGWRRNHRLFAAGDISAAVLANEVSFDDGTTVEDWKPATPGATAGAPVGTTIGGTIRPDGSIEGGVPAIDVIASLRAIPDLTDDLERLSDGAVATDAALASLGKAGVDRDAAQRLLGRGSDMLAEAALRLTLDTDRQRVVARDAGITIDPATGKARLYAVEDAVARTKQVEIIVDAQAASIRQRATYSDLERSIAEAQLEGKDIDLSGLYGRVSDAEVQVDALAGEIALRATTAQVDELGLTVGEVEQRLDSLGDDIGVRTDVRLVRRAGEEAARALLGGLVAQDHAGRAGRDAIVQARQELTARMDDAGAAIEARASTRLGAAIGQVDARLIAESTARIAAGEVIAEDIDALAVTTGQQAGAITDLSKASIDQERGLTVVRSTQRQQAALGDQTAEALLASLLVGDEAGRRARAQFAQVQSEQSTELIQGRLSEAAARAALAARLGLAEAEAVRLERARVDGDRVNAESIGQLSARVEDTRTGLPAAFAGIADVAKAVVDGDEVQATAIEEVSGKLGEVEASVTSLAEVVIGPDGAQTRAVMRLEANGLVSGTVQTNDGKTAAFGVLADKFGVYDTAGNLLFYVDADGAIAATFKPSAISADNLAEGAAQRATYFKLPQSIVLPRGYGVTIDMVFTKRDAESDVELMFYGHFASEDDLQFDHRFLIDGVVHQYTPPIELVLDNQNSRGASVITPFTLVTGLAAGPHTVSFHVTNRETDDKKLTIAVGAILKCIELRQASIGASTGSIGPIAPSGGGYDGNGGGGGGGITPVQQQ